MAQFPQVHWCLGDKSSLSACCNYADFWSVIFCSQCMGSCAPYQLAYICPAIPFRLKCITINYVYTLCWVCKWILDWYIYLYDNYFNMSAYISPFKLVLQPWWKKAAFAGAPSLEFNTCSLCHFLSASHDIGNYSALVRMEPGRLGVLLPCSWVSHSNRSKLAVTKAGLGSCCHASETLLFHWVSPHCQVNARLQVITAARNEEAQYNLSQIASFIRGWITAIEMYTLIRRTEIIAV